MKVKIISDGTPHGTMVLNAETGEQLSNVRAVRWEVDADHVLATAELEFFDVEVDVEATVDMTEEE